MTKYLQLYLASYLLAATFAHQAFLPKRTNAILVNPSSQQCLSLKQMQTMRGGSDRGNGYDERDYYNEDRGYGSDDRQGSTDRYYDDDRYGSRENDRYNDDYYGDDRDYAPSRKSSSSSPLKKVNVPDVGGLLRNGNKKIGMVLLGAGAVSTLLGISLFFNKTLMRLGNLLFIAGVPLFIGPGRTTGYFLQPKKARATGCLGVGIFLVMIGWPILGIALEAFGIMNLFGNMFPVFMVLLKQMPIIGPILKGDGGSKSKGKRQSYRDYDDDDRYDYSRDRDDDYRRDDDRYY